MSNMPDGMTTRDWRHIDGDNAHYRQCALSFAMRLPRAVCICDDLEQRWRDTADAEAERRWQERRDEGEIL